MSQLLNPAQAGVCGHRLPDCPFPGLGIPLEVLEPQGPDR